MKKILIIAVLLFLISAGNSVVFAENENNGSENKYITDSIESIICDNVQNCEAVKKDIKLSKEKVYDIYLNETGNIYEFYSSKFDIFGYIIAERNRLNNE